MRLAKGFTLLEMLVVLILTGLVTTLLIQGLLQVVRLDDRFGVEVFRSRQGAMQSAWFRQAVSGVVPDYPDGKHKFRGGESGFDGLTFSPLDAPDGSLVPLSWRLRFDARRGETLLLYGDAEDAPVILSWDGNHGKFEYLDAKGALHEAWPPALGKWPQVPTAIRLHAGQSGEARILVAAPRGPADTLPRAKDVQDR